MNISVGKYVDTSAGKCVIISAYECVNSGPRSRENVLAKWPLGGGIGVSYSFHCALAPQVGDYSPVVTRGVLFGNAGKGVPSRGAKIITWPAVITDGRGVRHWGMVQQVVGIWANR